jgi:hypothetical protein
VGVAARILDFSRHTDNRERIQRVDRLCTVQGMSAVFERMVEGAVDNGYHCIGEEVVLKRLRERAHFVRRYQGPWKICIGDDRRNNYPLASHFISLYVRIVLDSID